MLAAIRGAVGAKIKLRIRRAGNVTDISIIRALVQLPSAFWQPTTERRTGYIKFTHFSERIPDEVGQGVTEFYRLAVRSFVVDLRNNVGGLVDSAINVPGLS